MKKGFTLIELLAVIIILAIIAIIAVPTISNVVKKAKTKAAETSALNYIDAVEKYMILHDMNPDKYPYDIKGGTFNVAESTEISLLDIIIPKAKAEDNIPSLNSFINVKGDKPTSGSITTSEKGKVEEADLSLKGFSVAYANGVAVASAASGITPKGTKQITITEPGTIIEDIAEFANVEITTDGLVKPTGTKTITENGTGIDVSNYASVDVNVNPSIPIVLLWSNSASVSYGETINLSFDTSNYTHLLIYSTQISSSNTYLTNIIDYNVASTSSDYTFSNGAGKWGRSISVSSLTSSGLTVSIGASQYTASAYLPKKIYAINLADVPSN